MSSKNQKCIWKNFIKGYHFPGMFFSTEKIGHKPLLKNSEIVFMVPEFPPSEGGVGSYLYEIIQNITDRRVTVIAPKTVGCENFDALQSFNIQRVSLPNILFFPFSNQLATLIPLWGYFWKGIRIPQSAIVVCGSAHPIHLLLSWILKKIKGNKTIVVNYGLDILFPQKRIYRGLFNWLIRTAADHVITISRATTHLNLMIGVDPEKLKIIYPPVNYMKFGISQSSEKVVDKFNLYGKRCILSVGRLIERKGVDTVIKALPQILTSVPNVHYLIVGRGPAEARLKDMVADLRLQDRVSFVGYVSDNELGSFYSACDVFAMISRELPDKGDIEGFGIVFLEANYFGKPVIGGRSGGVIDAVVDHKTGLLVNPENQDEAAEAIIRILQEKELARSLGEYGRTRVLSEFTGKQAANQLLDIINNL